MIIIIWYSEEGYGRKHQESIRESYYDRDSKDLHAGICTNPQKGAQCMNRMIDLSDWRSRCMVCARLLHKKNTSKDSDNRDNNNNICLFRWRTTQARYEWTIRLYTALIIRYFYFFPYGIFIVYYFVSSSPAVH